MPSGMAKLFNFTLLQLSKCDVVYCLLVVICLDAIRYLNTDVLIRFIKSTRTPLERDILTI